MENSYFDKKLVILAEEFIKNKSKIVQSDKQYHSELSSGQLDLMKKLLDPNPNTRLTLEQATKHYWFLNSKTKIKQLSGKTVKKPLISL